MTCIRFELLCRVVPFAGLRMSLCQWHVDCCRRCQQAFASTVPLTQFLVTSEQVPASLNLWPGVRAKIASLGVPLASPEVALPKRNQPWRWAYAMAIATLLLVAGFWIVSHVRHSGPQPGLVADRPAVQTRVYSASIENRPARIFLIQSRNPDRTIFWIARNNKGS